MCALILFIKSQDLHCPSQVLWRLSPPLSQVLNKQITSSLVAKVVGVSLPLSSFKWIFLSLASLWYLIPSSIRHYDLLLLSRCQRSAHFFSRILSSLRLLHLWLLSFHSPCQPLGRGMHQFLYASACFVVSVICQPRWEDIELPIAFHSFNRYFFN